MRRRRFLGLLGAVPLAALAGLLGLNENRPDDYLTDPDQWHLSPPWEDNLSTADLSLESLRASYEDLRTS